MILTRVIPNYDWSNAHVEWARGLPFYIHRLKQLGLDTRDGPFLDAGCGTGQWVDALASLGKEAVGIDVRNSRLEIASIFLHGQTHLIRASVETLPVRDGLFKNIICYGVIMFVDAQKTLAEFNRVSCNNAHLYLCWNAIGWSLHLILSRKYNRSVKFQALQTILNTWQERKGTKYFSMTRMVGMLERAGFEVLTKDSEGSITVGSLDPRTVYGKGFGGFDKVLEALAVKTTVKTHRPQTRRELH